MQNAENACECVREKMIRIPGKNDTLFLSIQAAAPARACERGISAAESRCAREPCQPHAVRL